MNRHGQTLIVFILLLPLLLLLLAFVVDTGTILNEKTRLNSTLRTILRTTYKEKENASFDDKIISLLEENEIPTYNLQIENKKDFVRIKVQYEKESIFGNIIGIKSYAIKSVFYINNELKIEKE